MSVTIVLDTAGVEAYAAHRPPHELLLALELLRRAGSGRIVVPSITGVEALTGMPRDAMLNQAYKQVHLEEALPMDRARRAATLRQATSASAVDAVVAEAAVRHAADIVVSSDPGDMGQLLANGHAASVVLRA